MRFARQEIPVEDGLAVSFPGEKDPLLLTLCRPRDSRRHVHHTVNPFFPGRIQPDRSRPQYRWLIVKKDLQVNGSRWKTRPDGLRCSFQGRSILGCPRKSFWQS